MKTQLSSRRKTSSRGSTLVEGAFVLIVFCVLFIGIVDLAQLMFVHQFLTERVRGASRYAVVNDFDAASIQNMVLYGQVDDPGTGGVFGVTRSMVQATRLDAGTSEERVIVRVADYPIQFYTPVAAGMARGLPIAATARSEVNLQ